VLSGDSHIKGFATALQSVMTSEYQLFSVVKPGSNSNTIGESITETVEQLSKDDVLVISSGSNDYELDNFKLTFRHIKEYLSPLTHTNVLLLGIHFRYDLQNSTTINSKILKINKKLFKLVRISPNTSFLDSNNDSKLFTRHGLHRNKLGKNLIVTQISNHIFSTFKCQTSTSIPLPKDEHSEVLPDESQTKDATRSSNRLRKIPVTRSVDFLW
jgi:hypothetical protein